MSIDRYPYETDGEGSEDWWQDDQSPNHQDEPRVVIPEAVTDVYKDEDAVLFITAAGMGAALLAGYAIKRKLKGRKH